MHQKQVDFEADLSVKLRKHKPFDAKINEESLAKATAYRAKNSIKQMKETSYDLGVDVDNLMGRIDDDGADLIAMKLAQEV